MGKEKETINGKVVKRWFSRGKARIPVFEDGSIGVPNKASDISRSDYHYEKNKAKTNATYDKLMKAKEKASPKDWDKTRKAYNKYKKAYDKEQDYNRAMSSKEYKGDTSDLKGKHIRPNREDYEKDLENAKTYVDVPYKYGAYTPNEYIKAEVFERNQDETTVLVPSKLQITKSQLKEWNNGKDDFKEGDIVKAPYGIGNTYTGGELKDFKMLENGKYPTLEGKSKMVLTNEQIEKYRNRNTGMTKQEEQINFNKMTRKQLAEYIVDNQIERGVVKPENRDLQVNGRLKGVGASKAMSKQELLKGAEDIKEYYGENGLKAKIERYRIGKGRSSFRERLRKAELGKKSTNELKEMLKGFGIDPTGYNKEDLIIKVAYFLNRKK